MIQCFVNLLTSRPNLLRVPRVRTRFSSRSFAVTAPSVWNTPSPLKSHIFPSHILFSSPSENIFYILAFRPFSAHSTQDSAIFFRWHYALYKFTYLLTGTTQCCFVAIVVRPLRRWRTIIKIEKVVVMLSKSIFILNCRLPQDIIFVLPLCNHQFTD